MEITAAVAGSPLRTSTKSPPAPKTSPFHHSIMPGASASTTIGRTTNAANFSAALASFLPAIPAILASVAGFPSPTQRGRKRDRCVLFVEHDGARYVKHMLDFGSPRTAEAAGQLGISYEDCIRRPKMEFFVPGVDAKIAQLRFDHHRLRVQDALLSVHRLRQEILKQKRPAEDEPAKKSVPQGIVLFSQAPETDRSGSVTAAKKEYLCPAERKRVLEAVQHALTRIEVQKTETVQASSSPPKKDDKARKSPPPYKELMMSSGRPVERTARDSFSMTRYTGTKKGKYDLTGLVPFGRVKRRYPSLANQVAERRSEGIQAVEERRYKEQLQAQRDAEADLRWRHRRNELHELETKLKQAHDKFEHTMCQRAQLANMGRNVCDVKARSSLMVSEEISQRETVYRATAMHISEAKRNRQRQITLERIHRHEDNERSRREHSEAVFRLKCDQARSLESLRGMMARKLEKDGAALDLSAEERKEYWREMRRLNVMVQQENLTRIGRIAEKKRRRIWETHAMISERNRKLRGREQSVPRATVREAEMKTARQTEERFERLLGPVGTEVGADDMVSAGEVIRSLNERFELGLRLEQLEPRRKKGRQNRRERTESAREERNVE